MTRRVDGLTFDSLIARAVDRGVLQSPAQSATALWVDLEGIVDRLLAGGARHLPECQLIFVEVEHEELFERQVPFPQIDSMFSELCFTAVLRDCEYHPRQNNVIYVSNRLLDATKISRWQGKMLDRLAEFDPTIPSG